MNKLLALIVMLFVFSAHAAADIKLSDVYMNELPPNSPAAAVYFTAINDGTSFDKLIGASTDIAAVTEIHEHVFADGMMKMQKIDEVIMPIGKLQFKPKGYHLMLMQLNSYPKAGDVIPLVLEFADSGKVSVNIEVRKQ